MSHKRKDRHDVSTQRVDALAAAELQRAESKTSEKAKARTTEPTEEEGGFSWQLYYLFAVISLGLVILLGKIFGLF
jgi:hypothetical protein